MRNLFKVNNKDARTVSMMGITLQKWYLIEPVLTVINKRIDFPKQVQFPSITRNKLEMAIK